MIIYNKLDNYFVVSADRQSFLGFEMTGNLRETSPLSNKPVEANHSKQTTVNSHLTCSFESRCMVHKPERQTKANRQAAGIRLESQGAIRIPIK